MKLDKCNTIAILGSRNTGKSSLVFHLLKNYQGTRTIYLYAYPIDMGYKQIHTLNELAKLTNAIIYMDELQNHIRFYQKSTSETFLELLATMTHNNNTLIFTTPMSQFITKALDTFIDGYAYTKIDDLATLKNGSKAKRLLQGFSTKKKSRWALNLNLGEYISIMEGAEIGENNIFTFENPNISKAWKSEKNLNFSRKIPKNLPKKDLKTCEV